MRRSLERALAAQRASRRVEFREAFDPGADSDWGRLSRDIIAMANSGGGVILFGVNRTGQPTGAALPQLDARTVIDHLQQYAGTTFGDIELEEARKYSQTILAMIVGEAATPIVSPDGVVYFRHGARSQPATNHDLASLVDRRVAEARKSWVSAVRRAVNMPATTLPPEIRDSDSPDATPIRVVDDPRAPAFRLIDYDKTHPYRQKELLAAFRARVPDRPINQFDLLTIRHMHKTDDNPDFSHKPMFGSRQYSEKFLNWLVENAKSDPAFFENARRWYHDR